MSLFLTEVLVVVDEVGQLPLPVDGLARRAHGVGERAGAATEDTHFAHLKSDQLLLQIVQNSISSDVTTH